MAPLKQRPNVLIDIEQIGGMRKEAIELMTLNMITGHYKETVSTRFDNQDDAIDELKTSQNKVEKTLLRFVGDETQDGEFQRFLKSMTTFMDRQDKGLEEAAQERRLINTRLDRSDEITGALQKTSKSNARTLKLIAAIQLSGHAIWKIVAPIIILIYFIHKVWGWYHGAQ